MGYKHDPHLGWVLDDTEFAAEAKRFFQSMPESEYRRLHQYEWPPAESQVKPNTCGSCQFFKPPANDPEWQYRTHPKRGDMSHGEGLCGNMIATLGSWSIRTGRDSGCKHFAAAPDGQSTLKEK